MLGTRIAAIPKEYMKPQKTEKGGQPRRPFQ
jgi:hypothetical protein